MTYISNYRGLWTARQLRPDKIFGHVGVVDFGDTLQLGSPQPDRPVVVHNRHPAMRTDWLDETGAPWQLVRKIDDETGARLRVRQAALNPNYDPGTNNCEHLMNYVAEGQPYSPTAQFVVGVVLIAVLIGIATSD